MGNTESSKRSSKKKKNLKRPHHIVGGSTKAGKKYEKKVAPPKFIRASSLTLSTSKKKVASGRRLPLEEEFEYGSNFRKRERDLLQNVFDDLTDRTKTSGSMDKQTFLSFFNNAQGMLGERLFAAFDRDGNGNIDWNEFMSGVSQYARGTLEDKIKLLFQMFDFNDDESVSHVELTMMLHSLVITLLIKAKPVTHLLKDKFGTSSFFGDSFDGTQSSTKASDKNGSEGSDKKSEGNENLSTEEGLVASVDKQKEPRPALSIDPSKSSDVDSNGVRLSPRKVKKKDMVVTRLQKASRISHAETCRIVEELVLNAFESCDTNHDGELQYEEFRQWILENPSVLMQLEGIFINHCWTDPRFSARVPDGSSQGAPQANPKLLASKIGQDNDAERQIITCACCNWQLRFCHLCGSSLTIAGLPESAQDSTAAPPSLASTPNCVACEQFSKGKAGFDFCPQCGNKWQSGSSAPSTAGSAADLAKVSSGESYLEGTLLVCLEDSVITEALFLLRKSFLYRFNSQESKHASAILFLEGCFIESVSPTGDLHDEQEKYGFRIMSTNKTLQLYAKSRSERQAWMRVLRAAAKTNPFEDYYELGDPISSGRFATVHKSKHKKTGKEYAVKVLEKGEWTLEERHLLAGEISILKLLRHPFVIECKEVFESPSILYIVMPLFSAGTLADALSSCEGGCFAEDKVNLLMWRLFGALKYMHGLGVVHRDLKPENILIADANNVSSIKIADFGLSQFATPEEKMNQHCGTVAYVAPEVLKKSPYTSAVDVYSAGVIMFMLLCGDLPFWADDEKQLHKQVFYAKVKFKHSVWHGISENAKDLISKCLEKRPHLRIGVDEVLAHEWFKGHQETEARVLSKKQEKLRKKSLSQKMSDSLGTQQHAASA